MASRDIVTNLIANDKASKPIEKVGREAERSADKLEHLSRAEERLALEVEKAGLKVEKAQKAAANAEERYGRESLQAREATLRLKAAEHDLADAAEKVKHKTEAAARAQGELARKALEDAAANEEADNKTEGFHKRLLGMLPTFAKHASGLSLLTMGTKGFGSAMATALPVIGKVGAWVGSIGTAALSAVGPMIAFGSRLAGLAVQAAHFAAAIAPAAASLPGLVGGFELLKGTALLAQPALQGALAPIIEAFVGHRGKVNGKQGFIGGLRDQIGELTAKGLPSLVRGFLRVNFPTIADAMKRIAVAMNGVLLGVGKWVNSIQGQVAIRGIVEGTAQAVQDLAPHVTKLAIAFGNMVAAAGPVAFEHLSKYLGAAADQAARFLGSITRGQVITAWQMVDHLGTSFEHFVQRLRSWGSAIMDGVHWWKAHAEQIQRVRDILGIVTIAVGIATGGWIPALGAAVSLLVAHWREVTAVLDRVKQWFHGTSSSAQNVREVIGGLRDGVSDLVSWFKGQLLPALERGAHAVMPAIHTAIRMVTNTLHDNRDAISKVRGILTALGLVVTEVLIPWITFLAKNVIVYLGAEFSALIWIVNRVVLPGLRIFVKVVLGIFGAIVNGAADAFGWVPGLGPKLHEAANKFNKFAAQVNAALSGIKDQHVTVGATVSFTTGKGTASAGKKVGFFARGGMVSGPGGPKDDQVPALLSNGEFVVNAAAVQRHRGLLESINAQRYARGGLVLDPQANGLDRTMAAERKSLLAFAKAHAPSLDFGGGGGRRPGGLSDAEWYIISRESGGRTNAQNPTSTAFGLGQLLIANRQYYGRILGVSPNTTDYAAQLQMFRMYVADRYGTADNAARFWAAHHWYANGGVIREPVAGVGLRSGHRYMFGERGPETVTPGVRPRMGGTVVRYETTVNVEVTASAAAIQDRIQDAVKDGVRRGKFSPVVLPAGTH